MCGIVGIYNLNKEEVKVSNIILMRDSIIHRGPDDFGIYTDESFGVGFRRLKVYDPDNGHQQITTDDGRYTVVFDGKIYNYIEIRDKLIEKGITFKTRSETEVLLKLYIEKKENCLQDINGMFAFAIWDSQNKELFFARDRVGIKPFYYHFDNNRFLFASEIKAIIADKSVTREPDYRGISDYLHFMYIPDDKTFFKGINKLLPGHYGILNHKSGLQLFEYWDVDFSQNFKCESEIISDLKETLEDAVRLCLRSDVPVGCHLSGGIDSSVVTCLAAAYNPTKIYTFTGKFSESSYYDETKYAKIVSEYAKTNYVEITPGKACYKKVLPQLIWHMDEPCAGPGIIPQYFVCQTASSRVKVVLGGQGGDELFGGYNRYFFIKTSINKSPNLFKHRFEFLKNYFKQHGIRTTVKNIFKKLMKKSSLRLSFEELWVKNNTILNINDHLVAQNFRDILRDYNSGKTYLKHIIKKNEYSEFNRMLYHDLKCYLPALLQVEDRTSMAVSIESRVPILDHRIVELSAKIPPEIKVKLMQPKYIFKRAIEEVVPSEILARKDKKGFPTPINIWFKNDRALIEEILLEPRSVERGLFNPNEVKKIINSGENHILLWLLLNVELWFRIFIDQDSGFIDDDGKIREGISMFS